jgi:AraC-like DNA-binding protein
MEIVRAAALTGYFEVADKLHLDVMPLLRKAGLSRSMVNNRNRMLPARSVVQLLQESSVTSACPTFGLLMANQRKLSDLGAISVLIVHQPTLRDALGVLGEYRNRINTNLTLQVEQQGDTVVLCEHFSLNPPMVSRQVNDLALGVLYKLCRSIMPESWRPRCVCFSYAQPAPPNRSIYHRLFDCPVQFGSDFDGLVIESADLERQNPLADAALAGHARELVSAVIDPGHRTLTQEIEHSIRMLMPEGRATIGEVAHSLGTNLRTLQRRLEQENTSFSELLDRVRIQQVSQLFANRQLRLTDVAHLLGYTGLASFSAWYRARFDQTPSAARRLLREGTTA